MNQSNQGQQKTTEERLYRILNTHFSEEELRVTCADLNLDYDQLPGSKEEKIKALAALIAQRGQGIPRRRNVSRPGQPQPPPERIQTPPEHIPTSIPQMASPTSIPSYPARKSNYLMYGIIFGLGLGAALLVFTLGLLPSFNQPVILEITRVVEATRLVETTRLVEVTRLVEITDNQSQPESDSLSEAELTSLPVSPAPPPEPTTSTAIFTDNFQRGLAPEWQRAYGSIDMSNGKLTVVSPFDGYSYNHLAILEGYEWQDYILTTNLAPFYDGYAPNTARGGILVRELAGGQWAGFLILSGNRGVAFATFEKDGKYTIRSGSLVKGNEGDFSLRNREAELRVEASGNAYTLYINGQYITSATVDSSVPSRIALWARNSEHDEDSDGFSPRFEDIRIESVP